MLLTSLIYAKLDIHIFNLINKLLKQQFLSKILKMVNTRSKNVDSYAACSSGMEQNSDNESEYSFPNTLSRNQMNEFENGDLTNVRHNSNLSSVDRRFMEMNRQISDLTSIVLALTEKISSPTTECSGLNTVTNTNVTRSDKQSNFLQRIISCIRTMSQFATRQQFHVKSIS